MIPKAAIDIISEFEGFSAKPYLCPAGVWTIGLGDTEWRGHPVTANTKPITRAESEAALCDKLVKLSRQLDNVIKVPLNENQRSAILSLIYNIGFAAFRSSTLLRLLNDGNYELAAGQFSRWNKVNKRPMAGLTRRREAEKKLFLTPVKG